MTKENSAVIFEWNAPACTAKLAVESKHPGCTLTRGSVHLLIGCTEGDLETRLVVFGIDNKRSVDDFLPFTPDELRTALDLKRNKSVSNEGLAQDQGAEFATQNFARHGSRLKVFHNGRCFYFDIYKEAQVAMSRYMDHHFPRTG